MPRFFVSEESIDHSTDRISITGEDVNHIKNVLRLKPGDSVVLCDGNGTDYQVRVDRLEKDRVVTDITGIKPSGTEPPVDVTLYQGLPKSDKMDYIIQKSVELGIKRIVPVFTGRTVVRLDDRKDTEKKLARWRRISLEAAKQCNRGVVPEIDTPVSLEEALLMSREAQLGIIPYEMETRTGLKSSIRKEAKKVCIFIGPEGGFTGDEVEKAVHAGIIPVTLGPRILRTETAGIAALSIIMYELGDVGV